MSKINKRMKFKELTPPLFDVGDVVFKVSERTIDKKKECPDCLGQKFFSVTLPNGETRKMTCPTCASFSSPSGVITYYETKYIVEQYTIGSVRINTADKDPITYMCKETGVGSGAIYSERSFFCSYDEAQEEAEKLNLSEGDKP